MRYIVLLLILIVVCLYCLSLGRYSLSLEELYKILLMRFHLLEYDENLANAAFIFFDIRLPRVILALFCGATLGIAGASFQAIFKNPLASPDILGVTSGSAFGAVLALLFGLGVFWVNSLAFLFGIISLTLTLFIARGASNYVMIVLAGIIVAALFQSFISLVKYLADPQDVLPVITYWLLGSLQVSDVAQIVFCCVITSVGILILLFFRWKHNLLMLEDLEAKSLGLNVTQLRIILIVVNTLIISSIVSLCGIISWVGLIIPHIARLIFGSDNAKILPTSVFIGAIFMLIIDTMSRNLFGQEIPISVLSAFIGASVFLFILYRFKGVNL
ncbi:FecCD family ABC transporter permease [Helicobacter sp.]|uniref:FecCD family ABC transporter permease n=1 Tax=Helicobacter sp. TaxID=218 RepID=UPI0025C052C9|nr:iron ABC transporter permease [Helicobacter sp.]MCI5968296.1 iron ABC transporter permease [Helicobacter sp.]MDY2585388.1 iron ABC transporter permease [Helicobacter sp.]